MIKDTRAAFGQMRPAAFGQTMHTRAAFGQSLAFSMRSFLCACVRISPVFFFSTGQFETLVSRSHKGNVSLMPHPLTHHTHLPCVNLIISVRDESPQQFPGMTHLRL